MRVQTKIAIGTGVLVVLTLGLLIQAMLRQGTVKCEVCVTFQGRTECRTAAGADRDQARKTAIDNACGLLASGMTASIQCGNTPPDRVTCE